MWLGNTMARAPLHPKHPERICWGCEKYCPVNRLNCRETRVEHPCELFGDGWNDGANDEWNGIRSPKRKAEAELIHVR
jgi:hypothetical protein